MLHLSKVISTIDSHTAGECTRLVTGGLPPILGETMAEKLAYAAAELAWVPGLTMLEPRGHQDMFGAVLVAPCRPGADAGVLFMDNAGYEPMCGHGVIGVVTCLIALGLCKVAGPEALVTLDTAAGLVRAQARVEDGQAVEVSFDNVPAFATRREVRLAVGGLGELSVDIAFGGNFFVLVDAESLGLELDSGNAAHLAELGMHILRAANEQVHVRHPELPHINRIIDLRFLGRPHGAGAHSRNVVILGDHMVDRSPCGTGTCAEMALRYARGELGIGEPFVVESILDTRFTGQLVTETRVGQGAEALAAVVPRVTGSAYVTGWHQFALDPRDPFPEGFRLGA